MILLQNIITDIITKCNSPIITRCDKNVLQNASGFLFQNATVSLQNTRIIKRCVDFITKYAIVVTKRVGTGDLKSFQDPLNPVA